MCLAEKICILHLSFSHSFLSWFIVEYSCANTQCKVQRAKSVRRSGNSVAGLSLFQFAKEVHLTAVLRRAIFLIASIVCACITTLCEANQRTVQKFCFNYYTCIRCLWCLLSKSFTFVCMRNWIAYCTCK